MNTAPRTGPRTGPRPRPRAAARLRRLALRLGAGAAIGALLGAAVAQAAQPAAAQSAAVQGSTRSAPAGSAVTVSGRGEFKDMRFTVGQTRDLTSQAITVSWTGGTPTTFAGTQFNTDFVQIMQCWGTDDHAVPGNPGPPRTQCEYGASPTTDRGNWPGNAVDDTRTVTYSADPTGYGQDDRYGAGGAFGQGEVPFKSVDGTLVTAHTQNNPLFNYNTTNEIDFARTSADGTGKEFFEVQTDFEAPQLGCGAAVTKGGVSRPRSCWLVIVPQGHLDLDGQPYADHTQVNAGSPVSSTNWKNRIAVPLDFNPVDSSCALGSSERATVGSELAADAMTSWQTALCAHGGAVYGYTEIGEPDARRSLESDGSAGLAFTTKPLTAADTRYAPTALSAAVIGFTIERRARAGAPEDVRRLSGSKIESINLTPRLVAKLLTESYRGSVWGAVSTKFTGGTATPVAAPGYDWAKTNPLGLVTDPEFLAYNPQFTDLSVAETPSTDTDLLTALGHSDTAGAVWSWVLSDKKARQFLSGIPDPYGMTVNPNFSTNPDVNPGPAPFDAHRDDYPKSDPWCTVPPGAGQGATRQCMTDFHPYVDDMHAGALHTRRADTLWKSSWDPLSDPAAYKSPGPQTVGSRFVITVTDAASAARYGLQTAKLLNGDGKFTAPNAATLTAAAATVKGGAAGAVDPGTKAKNAYPLTEIVYAAVRPAGLDAPARKDYAALLRYAAGRGQLTGADPGDLPVGYAPLPKALRGQATAAAAALAAFKDPATATPTTAPPTTGGGSGPGGTSGGTTGGTTGGAGSGPTGGAAPPAAGAPAKTPGPTASPVPSYDGGRSVATAADGTTPADPGTRLRYAVPVGAALGLLAVAGAPFAGGARPGLPLRVPLPGGRAVTLDPARLRRLPPGRRG